MSISEVINQFEDLQRANYFEILIEPPPLLSRFDQTLLKFLALSTDFPFETINTTDLVTNSQKRRVATDIAYDPNAITFRLDSRGRILEFFQRWRNLVVGDDHRMGYYDDYVGTIYIRLLDRNMREVYSATLVEAYPVNRTSIPLSYDSDNSLATLSVSFSFLLAEYSQNGVFLSSDWFDMLTGQSSSIKLPWGADIILKNPFEDKAREVIRDASNAVNDFIGKIDNFGIGNFNVANIAQQKLKGLQQQVLSKYQNLIPTTVSKIKNKISLPRIKIF